MIFGITMRNNEHETRVSVCETNWQEKKKKKEKYKRNKITRTVQMKFTFALSTKF